MPGSIVLEHLGSHHKILLGIDAKSNYVCITPVCSWQCQKSYPGGPRLASIQGTGLSLALNLNGIIKLCYPYGRCQRGALGALNSSPLKKDLFRAWIFVDV